MNIRNYARWNDFSISDEEWMELTNGFDEVIVKLTDAEEPRIDAIRDKKDRKKQFKQLFKVMDEYQMLCEMEEEHQEKIFHSYLKKQGVKYLNQDISYEQARSLWIEHFLKGIPQKKIDACHIEEYLWYVFDYGVITDCLKKEEAKGKFNQADKSDVYLFNYEGFPVWHFDMPEKITASMFRLYFDADLYIMDGKFRWTLLFLPKRPNEFIWYSVNEQGG